MCKRNERKTVAELWSMTTEDENNDITRKTIVNDSENERAETLTSQVIDDAIPEAVKTEIQMLKSEMKQLKEENAFLKNRITALNENIVQM